MIVVVAYLVAIAAANLVVTWLGPASSVGTAFVFIGLTLTARDRLHDAWQGRNLKLKMALLIAGGGLLSYALNANAARIAIASVAAFTISETLDAVLYHALRRHSWYYRVNGSNAISAVADSVLFPTIAFGAFMPFIILGQILAKWVGGLAWSATLRPASLPVVALLLLLPAGAEAQIANVAVGRLVVDDFTDDVVELYVATPPLANFRANVVLSNPLDDLDARPTVLGQVSWDPIPLTGLDVGVVDTPFADPELTIGGHALRSIGPLMLTVLHSYQPKSSTWTTVAKIGVTWFRR